MRVALAISIVAASFDTACNYSFGLNGPVNQSMAILHHSLSDNVHSEMALGYRHLYGIAMTRSCDKALQHYSKAASKLKQEDYAQLSPVRLGLPREMDTNILEYYHYNADFKGDTQAQLALGQLYRHGTRSTPRNLDKSVLYFNKVIATNDAHAANARNNLGELHMEGEGVPKDISLAVKLFHSAAKDGNLHAYNNLGVIYRDGLEREVDKDKAVQFFKVAAEGEEPDGMYNYGMSLLKKDATQAYKLLQAAAKSSHLKAIHQLAIMFQKGIAVQKSCNTAVTFMKHVAERWNYERIETAYASYTLGDYDQALVQYLQASELGFEVAQSNVAYLIKEGKVNTIVNADQREQLLIVNNHRAANQGNVEARVWLGDYYFQHNNTQLATAFYHAAESEQSAVAMFNLGLLSEDLHIAKRYFDRALQTDPNAALPVNLALFYIQCKHAWRSLFKGGSIFLDSAVVSEEELKVKSPEQILLDDVLSPEEQHIVDEEAEEEADWYSDADSDIMFMLVLFAMAGVLFWARFNQNPAVFQQQAGNMNVPAPQL